jgi:hypothetical protein
MCLAPATLTSPATHAFYKVTRRRWPYWEVEGIFTGKVAKKSHLGQKINLLDEGKYVSDLKEYKLGITKMHRL